MMSTSLKHSGRGLAVVVVFAVACGDDTTNGEGGGGSSSTSSASGGGSPSSSGSGGDTATSSSGGGASTSVGGGTSVSVGGGGGGLPECDDAAACDDGSVCTTDSCVAGGCQNVPVVDGPAPVADDPVDCVDSVCTGGVLGTIADDTEDPADRSPPCQLTICLDGEPSPVFAAEGTSCGEDPLACDGAGACVGCDGTPDECGAPTVCAVPSCDLGTGVCDPGFTTDPVPDPIDGDCRGLACSGSDAAPSDVADDADVPADLSCSDRGCSAGSPTTPVAPLGTPCIGETGFCDGGGTGSASCRVCVDSANGNGVDAGCADPTPICDPIGNGGEGLCHGATAFDPTWSLDGLTFSNGNLSVATTSPSTRNVRTTVGRSSGRFYWEVTATGGDGTTNAGGLGILEAAMQVTAPWIGNLPSGLSFGYGTCCYATYWLNWAGVTTSGVPPVGSAVSNGTIYMFALDRGTGRFWAGQNGTWYNGGDPTTAINPAASGITGTVHAGITFYGSSINSFTANFGGSPMAHPVPTGFARGLY